jgi:hypothetical protein
MVPCGTPDSDSLSRYGGPSGRSEGAARKAAPRVRHDLSVTDLAQLSLRPARQPSAFDQQAHLQRRENLGALRG